MTMFTILLSFHKKMSDSFLLYRYTECRCHHWCCQSRCKDTARSVDSQCILANIRHIVNHSSLHGRYSHRHAVKHNTLITLTLHFIAENKDVTFDNSTWQKIIRKWSSTNVLISNIKKECFQVCSGSLKKNQTASQRAASMLYLPSKYTQFHLSHNRR